MSDTEALLSTLRDIQEPVAPAGLSSALVMAHLLLVVLLLVGWLARRQRLRHTWRNEAIFRVNQARQMEPESGVLALAKLLRQIVRLRTNHTHALVEEHWLQTLDKHFATDWFTRQQGRIFGADLYRPLDRSTIDLHALCDTLVSLIKSLPAKRPMSKIDHDSI
jgi:hypothetical protein